MARRFGARCVMRLAALVLAGVTGGFAVAAASPPHAARGMAAGERIYRDGVTISGKLVRATMPGGMALSSERVACAQCHRRSGMGSVEGLTRVPAVTAEALYRPGWENRRFLSSGFPRMARRPAYDKRSLARAIRHGIDSGGARLAAPMPRYNLGDRDMEALIAYLGSLGVGSPGVDEREIHFATVVTEGVPAAKRRALEEVLQGYVDDVNARPATSPNNAGTPRARRQWRLHLWELAGRPESWSHQLDDHYRRRPVFAVMGGLAAGSWQPMDRFCEKYRLPCLFPGTDLPPAVAGAYSLYLSRGVLLSADVLARYLRAHPPAGPVLQIYDARHAQSAAAAAALQAALLRDGMPAPEGYDIGAGDGLSLDAPMRGRAGVNLVIWLDRPDFETLRPWKPALERVIVSSDLTDRLPDVPPDFDGRVMAVHPFVLPEHRAARLSKLRAWLQAKGMPTDEERVRADAYFAASAAGASLMSIGGNFSRDYFFEQIENLPEYMASGSLYRRVALAAGQGFGAKGAYVVTLSAEGGPPAVNGWFVP